MLRKGKVNRLPSQGLSPSAVTFLASFPTCLSSTTHAGSWKEGLGTCLSLQWQVNSEELGWGLAL